MLISANNPNASLSVPSPHRKQRRGRGARGGGVGDGVTSTFRFLALIAMILPSLVAGQSMTCKNSSNTNYVQPSNATFAYLNSLGPDDLTFSGSVGCLH